MNLPLTRRQRQILDFFRAYVAENDISQIREVIRAEIQPLEGKIGQLETRGNLEQKVATIEAKMATKDDIAIIR